MPTKALKRNRVLVIVQNLPVPLDRRVWLECQALTSQGYEVSVICPRGPGDPARQKIDGIVIYKYRPAPQARGVLGFALEFSYSWIRTAVLSVLVWRRRGFDVIQACNPPDTYWLLARLWRLRGVRFVFDQHDLNPELFISRFGRPKSLSARIQYGFLLWLERNTYRAADHVISTNGSYRNIAIERGRRAATTVTIVRSGPDTRVMRPIYPDAAPGLGTGHVLVYLGIMGPQDGVDTLITVMDELVNVRRRTDVQLILMGFGDCLDDLKRQSTSLGLDGVIHFTGRVGLDRIATYLSGAEIGLGPDLNTPLNNVSTMNKTMEYMAYALPSVSFDLIETRVSGGDAVVYVPSGDLSGFADEIVRLIDDPVERERLGRAARERVSRELDWQEQAKAYVAVFDAVTGRTLDDSRRARWPFSARTDARMPGLNYVDLQNDAEYTKFLLSRGRSVTDDDPQSVPSSNPGS